MSTPARPSASTLEWWARQQALRDKFLPTVRKLLDEEPALRGEDGRRVRCSVEEFHRVLSQDAASGEAPRCDMSKLCLYETAFDGLLAALRRIREPASAPPPATSREGKACSCLQA